MELFNRLYVLEDITKMEENLASRRFPSRWVPGDYIVGSGGPPTDPAQEESESEGEPEKMSAKSEKKKKGLKKEGSSDEDKSGEDESSEEESESESDESDDAPPDPFTDNPMYAFVVTEPTHLSISLYQADRRWTVSRLGKD